MSSMKWLSHLVFSSLLVHADNSSLLLSPHFAQIYCIFVNSPIISVHRNSRFIQIVLNFFLILMYVHRFHGCEEYWMSISLETFYLPESIHTGWSSACRERSRRGRRSRRSHPVNDTLSCNVRSTRVPPESPWIARKYNECSAELGFKQ